jgi:hypothetical protein
MVKRDRIGSLAITGNVGPQLAGQLRDYVSRNELTLSQAMRRAISVLIEQADLCAMERGDQGPSVGALAG